MDGGTLAIVLLTAKRLNYAQKTLTRVLQNLIVPDGVQVAVHIASDGDTPEYINQLRVLANRPTTVSNSGGRGYGANYNLAMQTIHGLPGVRWVLPLEDDWELVRPLDVTPILGLLDGIGEIEPTDMGHPWVGCCRMGYLGYTQALRSTFIKYGGSHYLLFDPSSEEPHVFAGHPRIETTAWERMVGPWSEDLHPGATEWEVAHRESSREGVVWPIDLIKPYGDAFVHVGTERSY